MERDEEGRVKPYNDTSIPDDSLLLRGIPQLHIVNGKNGRKRVSSAVLKPSSAGRDPYQGLSVDVKYKLDEDKVDAVSFISSRVLPDGTSFAGALALKVISFRSRKFLVGYEPIPDNAYHGAVWQYEDVKLTRSIQKDLLKEAAWFIEAPDTDLYVED